MLHHVSDDDASRSTNANSTMNEDVTTILTSLFDPSACSSDERSKWIIAIVSDIGEVKSVNNINEMSVLKNGMVSWRPESPNCMM